MYPLGEDSPITVLDHVFGYNENSCLLNEVLFEGKHAFDITGSPTNCVWNMFKGSMSFHKW